MEGKCVARDMWNLFTWKWEQIVNVTKKRVRLPVHYFLIRGHEVTVLTPTPIFAKWCEMDNHIERDHEEQHLTA